MSYDFDMCLGDGCPIRDDCRRYTSIGVAPEPYYVMMVPPYKEGVCTEQLKIK